MGASLFSFPVVDVWNALPNTVVIALSPNSFKSRLNKHWHGYELKFSALCYIPGETVLSNFVRRCPNGSSKAVLFCGSFMFFLCLLCLCVRLFICALWSPAGKGLTSCLSFVVSGCEFVTFPEVS